MLQLATPVGRCVLIRMLDLQEIPNSLQDLLADKTVLKVGVGCLGDAKKVLQDHAVAVCGCVDLRHLVSRTRLITTGYSLKKLSKAALGIDLEKNILVRAGNWELNPLTPEQIQYAAMDALVGVRIFLVMLNKKLGLPPHRKYDVVTETAVWNKVLSVCQGIVDAKYNRRDYNDVWASQSSSVVPPSRPTPRPSRPPSSTSSTRAYSHRQRPLYYNCQLRAPDGQLLCTCDIKKAEWYIEKGLGEKIANDPLTIRLNFEPSGRPLDEKKNYYLQDKNNVCVVCGKDDSYIRANIVPQEYRKHFPPVLKEHRSHDIVLMCSSCHRKYGFSVQRLKNKLAAQCDAPLASGPGAKYCIDPALQQVKSAAKALLNPSATIPEPRKLELRHIVQNYYGVDTLTESLLTDAANMEVKLPNNSFVIHGQKVIQYMLENGGLVEFERMWRQNFVDEMNPGHLPAMWSVDHSHNELADMGKSMYSNVTAATKRLI